jgi:4-oxalocrotonate tautomerase
MEKEESKMPIVRVQMWSGRSEECKVNLAKAITDVVVEQLGCPLQAVTVVVEESPKENWVIGGQPCSGSPAGKK